MRDIELYRAILGLPPPWTRFTPGVRAVEDHLRTEPV